MKRVAITIKTILLLVGAGLGVSVAPACVRRIASPEVVCIPLRGAKVAAKSYISCSTTIQTLYFPLGESASVVEKMKGVPAFTRVANIQLSCPRASPRLMGL